MIELIPYVEINGNRSLSDDNVKQIFHRMKSEGTLHVVFYDGSIKTEDDFVAYLKSPNNLPVFILSDGELSGLAWLNRVEGNHATAHFCLLKNVWGEKSYDVGKKVLSYWFSFPGSDGEPLFDLLLGVIPSFNQKAIKYIEKLGFRVIGEIPKLYKNVYSGKFETTSISYVLRESYGR